MSTPGYTAEAALHRTSFTARTGAAAAPTQPVVIPAAGIDFYGNWCGPGNSGPGTPVDAVDEVCCRHDRCYSDRGSLDCSCDRDLIRRMPAAIADSSTSARGKALGAAALAAFLADPFCLCHRICVPIFGCTRVPPVPGIPGPLKLCPPPFS